MRSILLTSLRQARLHTAREDGAIALLTMVFMIVLGIVLVITLWSIAYATGAYNQLYAATQAAAYAAVGQTQPGYSGAQLNFECGSASYGLPDGATACSGGGVMNAVNAIFTASFQPASCGRVLTGFGLTWTTGSSCSTVSLYDAQGNPANYVEAYYVPISPGAAQSLYEAAGSPSCPYVAQQDGVTTDLICWGSPESGVASFPIFTSGIIVRTGIDLQPPVCYSFACPVFDLRISVAAEEGQPTAG